MKNITNSIFLLLTSCTLCFAATRTYPVSEVNFGAYNTAYNLNITGFASGSALNIYPPNGVENEDWRINYVSAGVYEIENSTTGTFITAGTNNVAQIATLANNTTQRWQIVGVTKDFLGEYLYYKIINVGNGKALTYSGTTVILSDYTGANNQMWRLDLDGLEGFAALCKVKEGIHASTIGGLLGPTVFVSTLAEFETAITDMVPRTIVVTANMDASVLGRDIKVGSYKTVIGSFAANTMSDLRMRTNSYGYRTNTSDVYRAPSDNIVFKNMTFAVSKVEDQIVFGAYSSKNIWLDHNTFYSTLDNNVGEVGKFVWINTPYDGADLSRSPDFITGSYNICRNRYWCWVYGTQNGVTTEDRTTIAFTYWDNNIRRQPEIGNGTLHTYNNYHIRTTGSSDNGALAAMIVDAGSSGYSEGSLFLNFRRETTGYWDSEILAGADREFIDIGSYTNKTASGDPTVLPTLWKNSVTNLPMTWKPSQYYSYKKLSGYNSNGVGDAKEFILKYSGSKSSMATFRYITDADVSSYVTESFSNPFLTTVLGVTDCAGVLNGTAVLDDCSRCIGGNTGKTACKSVGEAEIDACTFDGIVETKNTGFKGASYLNVDNAVGTAITFNVLASNAGNATLSFRYANGGTADRPAQTSLNGTVLANNLSFPVTGTFTDWKAVDITITLIKGMNTIKLSSTTAEGLSNIDQIGYVSPGLATGNCVITGIDQFSNNAGIMAFPNPFTERLTILQNGQFSYQIMNVEGRQMETGIATDKIELGNEWLPGFYFIKTQGVDGTKTFKISKVAH